MTANQVKEIVQSKLDQRSTANKRIKVVGVDPQPKDGQWQVLVEPAEGEPEPRYQYYEMLGQVEEDVYDDGKGIFVFLVPAPEGTYYYNVNGESFQVKDRVETFVVNPRQRPLAEAYFDKSKNHLGPSVASGEELASYQEALRQHLEAVRVAA